MTRLNGLLSLAIATAVLVLPTAAVVWPRVSEPEATGPQTAWAPEDLTSVPRLGRLAYLQAGDIWVKDVPDGKARRLTNDGHNSNPRWSASGQWLAFRKNTSPSGPVEVWVASGDGAASNRLNQGNANISWFEWAPRQDQIAFVTASTSSSFGALEVIDADGANRKQLVPSGVSHLAWSPDGAWIAFDVVDVTEVVKRDTPPNRRAAVRLIRPDGSGQRELLDAGPPSPNGFYGFLVSGWAGDGQEVIYWTNPGPSFLAGGAPVYAISTAGGRPRKLADAMLYHNDFWAASPGTDKLIIIEGGGRETWSRKRIALLDLPTGTVSYLTSSDIAAFSPVWSPDGRRIAFSAGPDIGFVGGGNDAKAGAGLRRLWVMDSNGANPWQLTHDPAYRDERPLWSSDGSQILFARVNAAGDQASLWLVAAGGGQPVVVADGLSWSAKGEPLWFGYYGHIDWGRSYDWWPGAGALAARDSKENHAR